MTMPDGHVIQYSYDGAGRVTGITPAGSQPFAFGYDANGRRTSLGYPNGATATYAYDTLGRLTSITHHTSAGSTIDSYAYTFDSVGNRLTKTDTEYRYDYSYDPVYRVLQSLPDRVAEDVAVEPLEESYAYDSVGNRQTGPYEEKPYTYNAGNELTSYDEHPYAYDANGSLVSKVDGETTWTYAYDYEGRLTQATKQSPVETETVTFKYGPFGRRIEKHVDDTINGVQSLKTYAYVYDKEDVALEYSTDGAQTETTRYVHGPGIDEPLSIEKDGSVYYYHADGLGSVTVLTNAGQQIAERYVYDSFGNFTVVREEVKNSFRFTGREWDAETGLYYYRARYYDPEVGRFISTDPIGFAGGDVNVYGYVGANPVNWVDPWGLYSCTYSVSKHTMTCTPNNIPNRSFSSTYYVSGNNSVAGCQNNASCQNIPFVGPIPLGSYIIGSQKPKSSRRNLTPSLLNNMFGRYSFQIHGCGNPAVCSEGCIGATTNSVRDDFNKLMDLELSNTLRVVP